MRKRGYKTELDLNNEQITACLKHAGCVRKAYNWGLARKEEAREASLPMPNARQLHRELNAPLKPLSFPTCTRVSKCAPQEALIDLDHAFTHFFRKVNLKKQGTWRGKCGHPTFKSRKKGIGGFRLTGAIHVFEKSIQLPRLGTLRLKEKLYLPRNAKIGVPLSPNKPGAGTHANKKAQPTADALNTDSPACTHELPTCATMLCTKPPLDW